MYTHTHTRCRLMTERQSAVATEAQRLMEEAAAPPPGAAGGSSGGGGVDDVGTAYMRLRVFGVTAPGVAGEVLAVD